ncbi:hypothetical protein [Actinoplanes sp. HUAS TT8]|uniref:hypothetical protein n=1 Tax=Actinoplanes sp. HUAS TT8 TaxID=3447453 RepID=UPI003F51F512
MADARGNSTVSRAAGWVFLAVAAAGVFAAFRAPDHLQIHGLIAAAAGAGAAAFLLHSGDFVGRLLNGLAGLLAVLVLTVAAGPATQLVQPGIYRQVRGEKVDAYPVGLCTGVVHSAQEKPKKYTCTAKWEVPGDHVVVGHLDVLSSDLDIDAQFGLWAYAFRDDASALSRIPEHYPSWLPWMIRFPWILAVPFLGLAIGFRRAAVRRADPYR